MQPKIVIGGWLTINLMSLLNIVLNIISLAIIYIQLHYLRVMVDLREMFELHAALEASKYFEA